MNKMLVPTGCGDVLFDERPVTINVGSTGVVKISLEYGLIAAAVL